MCFASLPCFVASCSSLSRREAEDTKWTSVSSWPVHFWLILLPGAVSGLCWLPRAPTWRFSLSFLHLVWRLQLYKRSCQSQAFRACLYLYNPGAGAVLSPRLPCYFKGDLWCTYLSGRRMLLQLKITSPFPRKTRRLGMKGKMHQTTASLCVEKLCKA